MASARTLALSFAALFALAPSGPLSAQGRVERLRAPFEPADAEERAVSTQSVRIPLAGDGGWPFSVAGHHGELHAASLTSDDPALTVSADLLFDGAERTLGLARQGAGPFVQDGCHVRSGGALERVCVARGTVELSQHEDPPSAAERRGGVLSVRVTERLVLVGVEREAGASTVRAIELAVVRTRTPLRSLVAAPH